MILGQISYLDCVAFLVFLAPQLIYRVGVWQTLKSAVEALPFLFSLPIDFARDHLITRKEDQTLFLQRATLFQDLVIRFVRYAFADVPASVGRVFFSKWVSLPFFKFRLLRHGYLRCPAFWTEINENGARGIWVTFEEQKTPDMVLFYCHGGGYTMGSSYFYLEFLVVWLTLLRQKGFKNPAIFALEYTLVPDAVYPTQLEEAVAGYSYTLNIVKDPACICVGGDSAGGTLILSLLLHIGSKKDWSSRRPGFATLISPWTHLVSSKNRETPSDYLSAETLHRFGRLYAGSELALQDPLVSPGSCVDEDWWQKAIPSKGSLLYFGSDELFAPGILDLLAVLRKARRDDEIEVYAEEGGIHAWPVAEVFLCDTLEKRINGLDYITTVIRKHMVSPKSEVNGTK